MLKPEIVELLHRAQEEGGITSTDVALDPIDYWLIEAESLGLLKGRAAGLDPFVKYTLTNKGRAALGMPPLTLWQRLFAR